MRWTLKQATVSNSGFKIIIVIVVVIFTVFLVSVIIIIIIIIIVVTICFFRCFNGHCIQQILTHYGRQPQARYSLEQVCMWIYVQQVPPYVIPTPGDQAFLYIKLKYVLRGRHPTLAKLASINSVTLEGFSCGIQQRGQSLLRVSSLGQITCQRISSLSISDVDFSSRLK